MEVEYTLLTHQSKVRISEFAKFCELAVCPMSENHLGFKEKFLLVNLTKHRTGSWTCQGLQSLPKTKIYESVILKMLLNFSFQTNAG